MAAGVHNGPCVCLVSRRAPAHYKDLDFGILSRHFRTLRHDYAYSGENIATFLGMVKQVDVVVSWFASPWMALLQPLIPKRVKLVVIAGGYDVADCPELRYGARHRFLHRLLTRRLLNRADLVLSVSEFNRNELLSFAQPRRSGMVYNAVDFPRFSVLPNIPRLGRVITVGAMEKVISVRKGHFRFIEVARRLPDVEFLLVGKPLDDTIDRLKEAAPPNATFAGYLGRDELLRAMLESAVYLQLSYHEAFGVSVAEAVACGCFPVVSSGTALPEIIGQSGRAVDGDNLDGAADEIRRALDNRSYESVDAGSVEERFGVVLREEKLVAAIESLIEGNG